MDRLIHIKNQLNYVLTSAMKTLDEAILAIPDDKLGFRPTSDSMNAAELGIHVFRGSLGLTLGTLSGQLTDEDFTIIPFDAKSIKSAREIVDYGGKVKSYIGKALNGLCVYLRMMNIKPPFIYGTG